MSSAPHFLPYCLPSLWGPLGSPTEHENGPAHPGQLLRLANGQHSPRARALARTEPPRVRLPAAAEPPHCPYCGVPTAVASRAGTAPRHSPGLCEMTEELPERLAAAESVLQPGAVVQLQGDADLHSEARGAGEGTAGSRGGPPRAPGAPTTRAYCVFPHRELPGLAAVCHAAMSTNVPRFLNFF